MYLENREKVSERIKDVIKQKVYDDANDAMLYLTAERIAKLVNPYIDNTPWADISKYRPVDPLTGTSQRQFVKESLIDAWGHNRTSWGNNNNMSSTNQQFWRKLRSQLPYGLTTERSVVVGG